MLADKVRRSYTGYVLNLLRVDAVSRNPISYTKYAIFVSLALSSLSVYGIIIAGWASNSKYAFIGALRSAAQMIAYEVSISLTILPIVLLAGALSFIEIVYAQRVTL